MYRVSMALLASELTTLARSQWLLDMNIPLELLLRAAAP